ncbi:chromosome transmission fidelity protein 4 [Monoraphidium neglectum]|uniref:Chromosome transmission fidelity protein 4 n=1 Tax=Monoraphidium neglectum TaxID=145388 RepID=A0A0D2MF90_9CHLO|nr:chromosome transmission fidelity protein 4 [Monoraphidium neglectum]KIY99401.1 chromosome transmission fidelity protein 4 [Monoraphidium neglectum]|eukprot:XP_013898421.1 chromosome transmission fidelity protein 4 [Monoraphidium neglectum]
MSANAGQDGKLVLRNGDEGLGVVKISGDHEKPAADLAVTPDGKSVVVIDDQYVQIYCTPDLDLLTSACRFTLPGRSVAVGGRDGDVLAAGGDDGLLKLVRISEGKVLRQIRTKGFVRSVSLDPEGSYVAASLADGNLGIWDVNDGSQEMRKHVCPKVDTASTRRSTVAWSPDGGALLAAPGRDGDVALLERLSWKAVQYLGGAHTGDVNTLAFSPNGVYLATGGLDKQVVVWLAEKGVAVAKTTLEEGDALLIAGEGGSVGLWSHVVPAGLPSPWRNQDEVLRHADAAAAGEAGAFG